jgi:hypothetical protein
MFDYSSVPETKSKKIKQAESRYDNVILTVWCLNILPDRTVPYRKEHRHGFTGNTSTFCCCCSCTSLLALRRKWYRYKVIGTEEQNIPAAEFSAAWYLAIYLSSSVLVSCCNYDLVRCCCSLFPLVWYRKSQRTKHLQRPSILAFPYTLTAQFCSHTCDAYIFYTRSTWI